MPRILIIEDERTLREEIGEILKFEGFEVLEAEHGKEGLALALNHKPDLILCDIMMPEMNGTDVLKNLMQSEDTRHLPFIFITALGERTDVRKGLDLGADDYLIKPFSVKELLGSVNSRLKKSELVQKRLQASVTATKNDLVKQLSQLKDKIVEQNNDLDLLRLEKLGVPPTSNPPEPISETLKVIDSVNKFHNIEKIVNKELRNKQLPKEIEKLFITVRNEIHKQSNLINNWAMFQLKFNQVCPQFYENLQGHFPNLKQSEIALASSIAMNLSTLQIASLLNITPASVRKNKYRLKKKLGLQKDDNLKAILYSFVIKK